MSNQVDGHTETLEDSLFRVQEYTTTGGRVTATVTNVTEVNRNSNSSNKPHTIRLDGKLPSGELFHEDMPYPETESTEYKYVRLCNKAGMPLAGVRQLEGTEFEATRDDDNNWVFFAPDRRGKILHTLLSVLSISLVQTLLLLVSCCIVLAGLLTIVATASTDVLRTLNIAALMTVGLLLCGLGIIVGDAYDD